MAINLEKLFDSGKHTFLAIDPSGSHLAYVIASLDFKSKEIFIIAAGMLWTPAPYDKGERLRYMQSCIDSLIINPPYSNYVLDAVVTEAFFSNPKMLTSGISVIPTVNSFLQMAASENKISYQEMGPTTWRSILGIKPRMVNGKRDFKEPAKDYVERYMKLPEKIKSNVDGRARNTPNDLSDALCIALAVAKYHGCDKVDFSNTWEYPMTLLIRFAQIAKGD